MSIQRPRIEDLPEDVREKLSSILSHSPESLRTEDQKFLRARRSYLTSEERAIFSEVLDNKIEAIDAEEIAIKEKEAVEEENVEGKVIMEETEDGREIKQINPDKFRRDALVQMAKDAGLPVDNSDTKKMLGDKINAHLRG